MRSYLVTSFDAARLPRWIPVLLCAVYAAFGLLGRDPWRTDDAAGFGIAYTMATGTAIDWLVPNVHGALAPEGGPLPFWLGAIGIRIAGGISALLGLGGGPGEAALGAIPADLAFRFVAVLGLVTSLTLVWYAAYAFGSRPEIQPDDPFGAAASRQDFGRAIADATLLATLACFGLLARVHETTATATQVTWIALLLFGLGIAPRRPRIGGLLVGAAIAATVLSRGLPLAAALLAAVAICTVTLRAYRLVALNLVGVGLPVALLAGLAWPALLVHLSEPGALLMAIGDGSGDGNGPGGVTPAAAMIVAGFLDAWLAWNGTQLQGPDLGSLGYYAQTVAWFFWPLWPLAAWALWRSGAQRREAPFAVPAVLLALLGALALLDAEGSEAALLPLTLPMALLTALALPTIRRGLVSVIDWFSVMTFSVVGLAIWAYWIALLTGVPPRMAQKAQEAVPGFVATLSPVELVLGLAATITWIVLVIWRVSRQPRPFWRPMALASGGMVLTWLLLMTLWLPAGNFRKSYREVAGPARELLSTMPDACVVASGFDRAQRALFAYYARARFVRLPRLDQATDGPDPSSCRWLLVSDRESRPHDIAAVATQVAAPGPWALAWYGQRRVNRGERLFLYARGDAAPMK